MRGLGAETEDNTDEIQTETSKSRTRWPLKTSASPPHGQRAHVRSTEPERPQRRPSGQRRRFGSPLLISSRSSVSSRVSHSPSFNRLTHSHLFRLLLEWRRCCLTQIMTNYGAERKTPNPGLIVIFLWRVGGGKGLVVDYLASANQIIPDWWVKVRFLGEDGTAVGLGIKFWFPDVGLSTSDSYLSLF